MDTFLSLCALLDYFGHCYSHPSQGSSQGFLTPLSAAFPNAFFHLCHRFPFPIPPPQGTILGPLHLAFCTFPWIVSLILIAAIITQPLMTHICDSLQTSWALDSCIQFSSNNPLRWSKFSKSKAELDTVIFFLMNTRYHPFAQNSSKFTHPALGKSLRHYNSLHGPI